MHFSTGDVSWLRVVDKAFSTGLTKVKFNSTVASSMRVKVSLICCPIWAVWASSFL